LDFDLLGAVTYVASFIFILTVIVFAHELGHYAVARWNGVRVEVFSIGFGPEILGWTDRVGSRWKVSWLPLGGYVKFYGEADVTSTRGLTLESEEERKGSFHHKPLGQRAAVVLGGPLANFLLAIVILAVLFATVGQRISPPDISTVMPDTAAAEGGLRPGDRVVRINDTAIARFEDIQRIVSHSPGVPLAIVVDRAGREVNLRVTPRLTEQTDRFGNTYKIGLLGIGRSGVTFVPLNPLQAVIEAGRETVHISVSTLASVWEMILGKRGTDELGGPVRIAQMSGQVAQDGLLSVFRFMAILSINLGLVNLFPIPMLDGGHLLFYAVEVLRGRPLSDRAREYGFRLGLAFVLSLMVFATIQDLGRFETIRSLFSYFVS